jgi:hypothetical protein
LLSWMHGLRKHGARHPVRGHADCGRKDVVLRRRDLRCSVEHDGLSLEIHPPCGRHQDMLGHDWLLELLEVRVLLIAEVMLLLLLELLLELLVVLELELLVVELLLVELLLELVLLGLRSCSCAG